MPPNPADAKQDSCYGNIKSKHCRNMKKSEKKKKGQFTSKDSIPIPPVRERSLKSCLFPVTLQCRYGFFQSQNVVKSDFFLSSFHQKTVAVDQKDHTEDYNNNFSG